MEQFVGTVVSGLTDPIDLDFARSLVADTSTDELEPEVLDQLASELLNVPARVWTQMFADLLVYDDLQELERITAPALLIWGDADRLVGRDMQAALVALLSGAELLVYPGVRHTPRWERPKRFADDVTAFVSRIR